MWRYLIAVTLAAMTLSGCSKDRSAAEAFAQAQRRNWFVAPRPTGVVALNAADEPLAVVVDLDQRAMAVAADSVQAITGDGSSFMRPCEAA
jgi:hypothetical protein